MRIPGSSGRREGRGRGEIRNPKSEIRSPKSKVNSPTHVSRFTFHVSVPTRHASRFAFTLIELMIVMAIMAVVMTMSAPAIYHLWHKSSMRKAVADIVEVCSHARALAIMRGGMTKLVFNAHDHSFTIEGAPVPAGHGSGGEAAPTAELSEMAPANAGLSGVFPDSVEIAVLKINGVNCMDKDRAFVRFYPNGTCDELRLILMDQSGDFRGIFLEITTSLASVESDRYKLQGELR